MVEHQLGGFDHFATQAGLALEGVDRAILDEVGIVVVHLVGVGRAVGATVQQLERAALAGIPDQARRGLNSVPVRSLWSARRPSVLAKASVMRHSSCTKSRRGNRHGGRAGGSPMSGWDVLVDALVALVFRTQQEVWPATAVDTSCSSAPCQAAEAG